MLTIFVDYGHICRLWYAYTLFDGLAYNTCGYFTSCVVLSNEQNILSYYMLNHRISGLLFHYTKKIVILLLASTFLVRVFRNTLIPSVKMTLILNKMIAGIICQTIEREVDYSTSKKKFILATNVRRR